MESRERAQPAPGLVRASVLDTRRWTDRGAPQPWLFAGSLGVDVVKTQSGA